jgi:2-oxoglutarate ferredoxin oxidoreductase subunit delta
MPTIVVNSNWCKGCYLCVELCPRHVLEVDQSAFVQGVHPVSVARAEDCSACRQCELLCPDLAIQVTDEAAELPPA